MRVLVTGITGFIGGEIASKLISENHEVVGLGRNGDQQSKGIKILKADITTKDEVSKYYQGEVFDAVIHCAGLAHQFGKIERERFESVNVKGTENISDLAVKTQSAQFILISSTAVYGMQKKAMDESAECLPETVYAESKLESENVCRKICEQNGISLTIFRLAPVLGEKGIGNVPRLIKAIYKNRFFWVGKGENKKSLVYVGDIGDACLTILNKKKKQTEIFNLASPPVKMKKLVSIISDTLQKKVPRLVLPTYIPSKIFNFNEKFLKMKSLEKMSQIFEKWLSEDIYPAEKITADYGFIPKTPIEQAVRRQCEWFVKNKKDKT